MLDLWILAPGCRLLHALDTVPPPSHVPVTLGSDARSLTCRQGSGLVYGGTSSVARLVVFLDALNGTYLPADRQPGIGSWSPEHSPSILQSLV
ncbi:hypothetical protein WG66_016533 [Moniliophthora roreri]|nr:hypothetical protein WG66_016533 [Moniliophthora roreri]